jgi:hypothetical protein
MKKIMTLVAAMIMVVAVNASNKSMEYAVEAPGRVAPFSEVNVNVPSRIRVVQGEDYGVMINGEAVYDSTLLDFEVKDGVLYISTKCTDMLSASGRGTVITLITPATDAVIKTGDDVQPLRRKR